VTASTPTAEQPTTPRLVLCTGDLTPCCDAPAKHDPIGLSLCSGNHGYTFVCPHCGLLYGIDGMQADGWGYESGNKPRHPRSVWRVRRARR
jgi:hypothetical protein